MKNKNWNYVLTIIQLSLFMVLISISIAVAGSQAKKTKPIKTNITSVVRIVGVKSITPTKTPKSNPTPKSTVKAIISPAGTGKPSASKPVTAVKTATPKPAGTGKPITPKPAGTGKLISPRLAGTGSPVTNKNNTPIPTPKPTPITTTMKTTNKAKNNVEAKINTANSNVAIIGFTGDGGFTDEFQVPNSDTFTDHDYLIVEGYITDEKLIEQVVAYAKENYGEKKIIIYAYSAGGYQVQALINGLNEANLNDNISGLVMVDAIPQQSGFTDLVENIGVPVNIYATHETTRPISSRSREFGQKMDKNDNISYELLDITHGEAASKDSVLTDILEKIDTEASS
jgi:hypothetical protein